MSAAARELYRLGVDAQAAGRLDDAIRLIDAALRLKPDFAQALCSGGYILQSLGHAAGALAFYDRALEFEPADAIAWFNRGCLLLAHGKADAALDSFERSCATRPDDPGAHSNRGAALFALGRLAEAADASRRALALRPDFAEAELNLGNALMRLGQYAESRQAYLRALDIRADYAAAWCGLGIVAKEMGSFVEAMRAFDEALRISPDHGEALANKGCLQLLLGNFADGWEGYEHRWAFGERPVPRCDVRFRGAEAKGLAGRKILVVNDHGLGDTIQFFRYVALLDAAGAEVSFAGPPRMRRLLSSSSARVAWRDEKVLAGDFDDIIAISSLPRAFATRPDSIPSMAAYLFAEPERISYWRCKITSPGPNIGLCWRGNLDFRVDPLRSIPPAALAPLARISNATFYSLQKDGVLDELPAQLAARTQIFGTGFDDGDDAFIDTAAAMASLDLVVSCDTSIAHLAGALGRPVWVALRHVAEWRWMTDRSDSPWYPGMRLFRCGAREDWTELFKEIADEIERTNAV